MNKFKEFITFKNAFMIALVIAILLLSTCNSKGTITKIFKVPEITIKTDTVYLDSIVPVNVKYKDGTAVVNKDTYQRYEEEKDTVKKKEILIEAITIRDNSTTVQDDSIAKVVVNTKVEGKLLAVQADITVKERKLPIQVNRNPRLSLVTGIDLTYSNGNFNPILNAGIQTRNGNIYKVGKGLNNSVMIGFSKTFTIIK